MSAVLDALARELATFIRRVTARVDYEALYPCTVRAQDGQTLSLEPDRTSVTATFPDLVGIPIRHGLPGVRVTVAAGARVLLGFEQGDPSRPFAALWETGSVVGITLNDGARKTARDGESVKPGGIALPPAGMVGWMAQVTATVNGLVPLSIPAPPTTLGTVDGGTDVLKVP